MTKPNQPDDKKISIPPYIKRLLTRDIELQINGRVMVRAGNEMRNLFAKYHRGEREEPSFDDYMGCFRKNELEHMVLAYENLAKIRSKLDSKK